MDNTPRRSPGIIWPMIIVALLFAAGVGYWAYQAGEAHAIQQSAEQSARIIVPPATASAPYPAPYPYPYPYYGWHRPWGFGFFFGPLLFFVFFLVVIRSLVWRRRRFFGDGHGGYGYGGDCDPRSRLDEWHRQAHARDGGTPPEGGVSPA